MDTALSPTQIAEVNALIVAATNEMNMEMKFNDLDDRVKTLRSEVDDIKGVTEKTLPSADAMLAQM